MSGTTEQETHPNPQETEQPAGAVVQQPGEGEGAERTAGESGAPQQQPTESQPSPQPDWRDRRIATLTRRLRELQEKQPPVQGAPPTAQPTAQPQAPDQALIDARARELSIIQDFNRRCDEAALAGRAQFGENDFNNRIASLQRLSDPTDPISVNAYNSLLMAALEAGEAPRLLYELGADLNEAQRILGMSPTKMAVELTKRAARPPVQVSNATRPIAPIGGRPASHERIEPDDPDRSDHLSTEEWMRRREQQLATRRQAAG